MNNNYFGRFFVLIFSILLSAGLFFAYSLSTSSKACTDCVPQPEKDFTLSVDSFGCGEQDITIGGVYVYTVPVHEDWLEIKIDGDLVEVKHVDQDNPDWNNWSVVKNLGVGIHTVEAKLYDAKNASGDLTGLIKEENVRLEIVECTPVCEVESWTCQECQVAPDEGVCYEDFTNYCSEYYGCGWVSSCPDRSLVDASFDESDSVCEKTWVCKDTCGPAHNPDVCANIDGVQTSVPEGKHLDASGRNCVEFGVPGVPEPSDPGTGGQVLGASTMAGTGVVEDSIFYSIFALGSLLTSLGIMKNGKKSLQV